MKNLSKFWVDKNESFIKGLITRENKIRRVVVREIWEWKLERMKLLKSWNVGLGNDFDGIFWADTVGIQENASQAISIQNKRTIIWLKTDLIFNLIVQLHNLNLSPLSSSLRFGWWCLYCSSPLFLHLLLCCILTPNSDISHSMLGLGGWIIPRIYLIITLLLECDISTLHGEHYGVPR